MSIVPGAQDFGAGGPDGRLPGAAGKEAGAGHGERGGGAEDEHGGAAEGQAEGDHAARRGAVPQRGEADLDAGVGQQQREVQPSQLALAVNERAKKLYQ